MVIFCEPGDCLSNRNFWRCCREGDKIFLAEKEENQKGKFLSVTKLLEGGRRYSLIIPSGSYSRGGLQLGSTLNSLLFTKNTWFHQRPSLKGSEVLGKEILFLHFFLL